MIECLGEDWNYIWDTNSARFEINNILFVVPDSEEKWSRLVSDFGRVCKRRKLQVNVRRVKL